MCTTIAGKTEVSGSGKGPAGWFRIEQAYVGYDHPFHAPFDHALTLDFVDERAPDDGAASGARVAVELSRESARELAHRILETLERADRYEAG